LVPFVAARPIFGAGNLGRRTAAGLRKLGIEPQCFIDSNKDRWRAQIEGLTVYSAEEGARLYGSPDVFVVTIWGALGHDRMATRIARLQQLGCARVVSFVPLYWKFSDVFLPHYTIDLPHHVLEEADKVRVAFELMSDDDSRQEYLNQLRFRLFGDFGCLRKPVAGSIYFQRSLFASTGRDVFVDCGAFDGDSIDLFLQESDGHFDKVFAFEPDPENFSKLSSKIGQYSEAIRHRINLYEAANGASDTRLKMAIGVGPSSQVGQGNYEIQSCSLDSALRGMSVTIIKMDIEGSEIAALNGAKELIKANRPVLAISAYHRQSDLWNLPLLMHELNPDYSIFLRPHMLEGWDLVCYAIPSDRRV
jgi:FkbM family methyltransferase